jgi:hypothetical protein
MIPHNAKAQQLHPRKSGLLKEQASKDFLLFISKQERLGVGRRGKLWPTLSYFVA